MAAETGSGSSADAIGAEFGDLVRMLDVATALRKERHRAQRELDRDESRRLLRERLLASARITGDPVTEAEVDAAIEQYFGQRHLYRAADLGWVRLPALLWVRRRTSMLVWLAAAVLLAALLSILAVI